ncbi:MAG TPA: DUF503 domain-containing protein [Thermomicrobiales bacterium]|nr:DUF503 domain-containing protein [Thermomicrobiales bacterium]
MAITIGVARVGLHLGESFSLKDKRRVVRSITQRVRNQYNVGIAEVEDLDDVRVATLALTCISNSAPHADEMLARVITFIENRVEQGVVAEIDTELISWS